MTSNCSKCKGMHLDNYILSHMGLVQNQTYLRIGGQNLHCVPYNISCTESKLIVCLTPEEHKLFKQHSGEMHKLYMSIEDPETLEIITIFVNTKINIYDQLPQENNFCFIDVDFKSPPQPLTTLVKTLCNKETDSKLYYEKFKNDYPMLEIKQIRKAGIEDYISLRLSNQSKVTAKIIEMSFSSMNVFFDLNGLNRSDFETVKVEIIRNGLSLFADAKAIDFKESAEVNGFVFLTLEINYNFSFVDSLMPIYAYLKRINN